MNKVRHMFIPGFGLQGLCNTSASTPELFRVPTLSCFPPPREAYQRLTQLGSGREFANVSQANWTRMDA
eukprot:1421856-Amphidinium_carterae.1